jgi:acyl-CoA hydrolase
LNEPTVEQALIVPQFRTALADELRQAAKLRRNTRIHAPHPDLQSRQLVV